MSTPPPPAGPPPIDAAYLQEVLLELLRIPSPTGRTDTVMRVIGDRLVDLGVATTLTRRGVLRATLPGRVTAASRAVVVHADTIGCMVRRLKDNGRLEVVPMGTHSARFSEGANVTIFVDDPEVVLTGTVLPLQSSGHAFGDEVDTQGVGWPLVEVRVDAPVDDAAGLAALGLQVGDFVALDAAPQVTPDGYVKSRHLDDKAGVAAALAAVKALVGAGRPLPVTAHLLVTIGEEVGMGATHGLDASVAELVAVDNAVVAPGQQSREETANVCMSDMSGPFDYHLSRKLLALCAAHGIPARRDIYRYYRSDAAPAVEAGVECRTALVGAGIDSSHGHERTHLDGVLRLAELLAAYLDSGLTFPEWDTEEAGPVAEFPGASAQPAEPEPAPRHG